MNIDNQLDLVMERIVDVPRELIWKAWTTPEHLMKWFCPRPWKTVECEIELRPGGCFRTVMQSPDGETFPNEGCYLEIIPNEKLVWTDSLERDYRPSRQANECIESFFTANLILEPHTEGTKYTVIVLHSNPEARQRHQERGFEEGWGTALTQLVELVKTW